MLPSEEHGRLFISYAHEDAEVVNTICAQLVAHGLTIWLDQHQIGAGDDIVEQLNRGLRESKIFIAFAGLGYFRAGRFTTAEYGAAFHKAMGADSWRIVVVRLQREVELPPLAASRLYIEHSTVAETVTALLEVARRAERWDIAPAQSAIALPPTARENGALDFADMTLRDLEITVRAFLQRRPHLIGLPQRTLAVEVELPGRRTVRLQILRSLVETESLMISLADIAERVDIARRFVASYNKQIDEGFLGKFEIPVQIHLEKSMRRLDEACGQLREEFASIIERVEILLR